MIDIVFEYERLLNFPNNISRYESFFAFDKAGVLKFLSENQIEDYKIYEVESKYCEKHNMRLLKGNVNFIMFIKGCHFIECLYYTLCLNVFLRKIEIPQKCFNIIF